MNDLEYLRRGVLLLTYAGVGILMWGRYSDPAAAVVEARTWPVWSLVLTILSSMSTVAYATLVVLRVFCDAVWVSRLNWCRRRLAKTKTAAVEPVVDLVEINKKNPSVFPSLLQFELYVTASAIALYVVIFIQLLFEMLAAHADSYSATSDGLLLGLNMILFAFHFLAFLQDKSKFAAAQADQKLAA